MKQFERYQHLTAVAANAAARTGYDLDTLRAHNKDMMLMKARRSVATALLEAGATWRDCGRLMKRDDTTIREMVLRCGPRPAVKANPDYHGHLCDCDDCLNGHILSARDATKVGESDAVKSA